MLAGMRMGCRDPTAQQHISHPPAAVRRWESSKREQPGKSRGQRRETIPADKVKARKKHPKSSIQSLVRQGGGSAALGTEAARPRGRRRAPSARSCPLHGSAPAPLSRSSGDVPPPRLDPLKPTTCFLPRSSCPSISNPRMHRGCVGTGNLTTVTTGGREQDPGRCDPGITMGAGDATARVIPAPEGSWTSWATREGSALGYISPSGGNVGPSGLK